METSVETIFKGLKSRQFDPVYFLQGEEPFFIDQIADYIEENVLSDPEKAFNLIILYGRDTRMADVLTNARRFPMAAERQVVIIKEAQDIPDLNKEAGAKLLLDYLQHPVPTTLLVLCHKYKTLDKRRELGKKVSKLATTLTSKRLYENQLPDFVHELVRSSGYSIGEEAVEVCCEFVGNSLERLNNELKKIMVALEAGAEITTDLVMRHVGVSREYSIFELQRAIVNKDRFGAHRIAEHFEHNAKKNPLIPLVAFLYGFFSKLMALATVEAINRDEVVKTLRISPYAMRDYSVALKYFGREQIERNLGYLKDADLRLKGVDAGRGAEDRLLRELVFKLLL